MRDSFHYRHQVRILPPLVVAYRDEMQDSATWAAVARSRCSTPNSASRCRITAEMFIGLFCLIN